MVANSLFTLPRMVSVGTVMLLITGMIFIGADYLYGGFGDLVRDRLLSIIVFLVIAAITVNTKLPTSDKSAVGGLGNFAIGALLTGVAVAGIGLLLPSSVIALTEPLGAITLTVGGGVLIMLIIAYTEELIFRSLLPNSARLKDLLSNVLFGLYHIFVLLLTNPATTVTELATAISILIALGFVWSYMRDRIGFMAAVGSHFAWNLKALGLI